MRIQVSLMLIWYFNVMHLRCCSYMLPLLLFVRTEDEHAFLSVLIRMCFIRKYKLCLFDGHLRVHTWACSWMDWRMVITYILMFFCSCVFYLLLPSILADIVLSLRSNPWSWPGMTASLALVMFCGWLLVFRQKNIRTKGYHWFLNVYANEFATHSLINVLHLWCWVFNSFCCIKTEGSFFCFL